MILLPEAIFRLLVAIFVGGLVGAEREFRDKAAGFRTIIFICTGACLFTMFSLNLGGTEDPIRIAASIVSGVGFLGAGAIMRGAGQVMGLTTAATIWLAAALGMGIGGGYYVMIGVATALILMVLWIFPRIEKVIDNIQDARSYEMVCTMEPDIRDELNVLFADSGLNVRSRRQMKADGNAIFIWYAKGAPDSHDRVTEKLLAHSDVKEFKF